METLRNRSCALNENIDDTDEVINHEMKFLVGNIFTRTTNIESVIGDHGECIRKFKM